MALLKHLSFCVEKLFLQLTINKLISLKVAKKDQRLIGLMVDRLYGQYAHAWFIGSMVDRLDG